METVSDSTCPHSSEIITLEQPRDGLSDYSPMDAPWNVHRGQADDVGGIYATALEFERYAARMADCGGVLSLDSPGFTCENIARVVLLDSPDITRDGMLSLDSPPFQGGGDRPKGGGVVRGN